MAIFERLRNLFSVTVKLTFYDITSTYFYGELQDLTPIFTYLFAIFLTPIFFYLFGS